MEGLEKLIGDREREGRLGNTASWADSVFGGVLRLLASPNCHVATSPRRHVARGIAGPDATRGHGPDGLAFRSSPPYRRTPCRKRKSAKGDWSRHTSQSTWRALSRRRGDVRSLPAPSRYRAFCGQKDLTQYDTCLAGSFNGWVSTGR